MAQKVYIESGPETAKIRHPVIVPVLWLITLGIYGLYWWYQVNREMADLGRKRQADGLGDQPFVSLLALFPGAIIIVPPFVSLYNGVQRIKRAQEVTLGSVTMNGWIVLAFVLATFFTALAWLIVPGYIQSELNKVWEQQAQQGRAAAGELPQEQLPPTPSEQMPAPSEQVPPQT